MKNIKIFNLTILLFIMTFIFTPVTYANYSTVNNTEAKVKDVSSAGDILSENFRIKVADREHGWLLATHMKNLNTLYISVNHGDSFFEIEQFDTKIQSVHISDSGTIFVSVSPNRWENSNKSKIYRSMENISKFEEILDIRSGAVVSWNFDSKDEVIYISEYGYKSINHPLTPYNFMESSVEGFGNARRIYKSLDDGKTWNVVYKPQAEDDFHLHKTLIDDYSNDVYQVYGDTRKGILKSNDGGDSWTTVTTGIHPTSAINLDEFILFGLDDSPFSGIVKFNKSTHQLNTVYKTPNYLGGSIYAMERFGNTIVAFLSSYDSQDWNGSVVVSNDLGNSWRILEEIESVPKIGVGLFVSTQDEDYVYISGSFPKLDNDGDYIKYNGTIRYEKGVFYE